MSCAGSIGCGVSNGNARFWIGDSKLFVAGQPVQPYGRAWFGSPSGFMFADPLDVDGEGRRWSRVRCDQVYFVVSVVCAQVEDVGFGGLRKHPHRQRCE